MTTYRIDSKPEWSSLVPHLREASEPVLATFLRIIRAQAFEVLAELAWDGLDHARREAEHGAEGRSWIVGQAEAADTRYLDALDEAGGFANEGVLKLFAVAMALSALACTTEPDARTAVLEGAYELSVISDTRSAKLRQELEAATQMA